VDSGGNNGCRTWFDDLDESNIPMHCIECTYVNCHDDGHFDALEMYLCSISEACLSSAARSIPYTAPRSSSCRIAVWDEAV